MVRQRTPPKPGSSWWSQQPVEVRVAIIGLIGIVISAIVGPSVVSIVSRNSISPTPTITPSPLTQQPGIYLTRVVNPPTLFRAGQSELTSVWVQAVGEKSYTIDSIEDNGEAGCETSAGDNTYSGAIAPDASYTFKLQELRSRPMPLNPALRLTPQDPREVSFTLGLSFSDNKNCSAVTLIELGYHDSVGNTGSFSLVNMSPDAVSLSKLLDENVLINYEGAAPYVIAPIGLQIGNDASVKAVEYLPLSLPDVSPEVLTTNPIPNISIENIDKREAINTIINQKQLVDQLVSALDNGEPIAFELCAGLIVDKCERALVKAVENHTHLDLALEALTIQHAIHPNDTLSDTIMQNLSATKTFYASRSPQDTSQLLRDMAFVLAAKKAGNWADPILELAKLQQGSYWTDVCDILTAVKDQLTEIQSKQENIICAPPIYPTRAVPTDAPTWAVPTDAREPTEPS